MRPPRGIDEGYHLSADLADRAIEFVGDLRAVDARTPVLPLPLHRGLPLSASGPEGVDRPVPGRLRRRVGRLARARLRPPAVSSGSCRPAPGSPHGLPGCLAWEDLGDVERTLAARFMECFAGFLSYTDEQLGRVFTFLEDVGRPGRHVGHPRLGQRRQLGGWVAGIDQRHPAREPRPGLAQRDARADRRDRRPDDAQQLSVGLDHGRQHPFQALEARSARGRAWRIRAS